jgi:hypothetical protein
MLTGPVYVSHPLEFGDDIQGPEEVAQVHKANHWQPGMGDSQYIYIIVKKDATLSGGN